MELGELRSRAFGTRLPATRSPGRQTPRLFSDGYQKYALEIISEALNQYAVDGVFFNMFGYTNLGSRHRTGIIAGLSV
jgi:hypothetical protein